MSRDILDLSHEKWQCEHIRPGQGVREEFHKIPCERQGAAFNWNSARVPGDVYTDLHRAGEIKDPFYGRNMHKMKWVQEQEYWYLCKFNIPDCMQEKLLDIKFEGVDYSCTVWFNGHELGSHKGMFSGFSFEITKFVNHASWQGGSNILIIRLDPPPRNFERVSGMKFNFNGDYHTGLVPFGIWRPVKIIAHAPAMIENMRIESQVNGNNAKVFFEILIKQKNAHSETKTINLSVKGKNCAARPIRQAKTVRLDTGENKINFEIDLKNAPLWWPWDMGKQNLHSVMIQVLDRDRVEDELEETFGIRQVKMEMNPGYTALEAENPWTFNINGKNTYLRAACWGGPPSLLYGRNNNQKYEHLLKLVKEANINHLRIFGWHPPEIPLFYQLCDELGITVWTNFTFSTNVIRKELPFAHEMIAECMAIVKERRNHPCLIFWMGGEEVSFTPAHVLSGNKKLMTLIGEEIKKHTHTPYGPASPLSNETGIKMGYKPKESQHANEHYYGAGKIFMEDYYPGLDCCIIPELTAASAPNVASLRKFIPENELWPIGISWAYHWADLDILKILNYEVFHDLKMGSLEEFVAATQQAHGIILQYALEHFRRRKPLTSGVALCHFMTHWPDIKWGIVDYYGEKKQCYDYVKKTYRPLLISLEYKKRRWQAERFKASIWIVNDFYTSYEELIIDYQVKDDQNEMIKQDQIKIAMVQENSSKKYTDLSFAVPDGKTFHIELSLMDHSKQLLSENSYQFLIANQEEAKKRGRKMAENADERAGQWPGFYKYFPGLWSCLND